MLHKRDEHAVDGWDPEDHPRSVLSGRDQRRGRGRPRPRLDASTVRRAPRPPSPRVPTPPPPTSSPRSTRSRRRAPGRSQGHELALTNLDKVLFPARDGRCRVTKRELVRYYAQIAPVAAPVPRRPAAQPAPLPRRRRRARASGRSRRRSTRPTWITRWRNDDADPGESERVPRGRQPAGAGLAREPRRGRAAPVDVADPRRAPPDLRARRPRSRRATRPGTTCSCSPACTAPRSSTSACAATRRPPASGAPDLGPDRTGLHVRRDTGVGRAAVARDRRRRAATS